ncbi:unnamed protein product [Alopecurus aequalis]
MKHSKSSSNRDGDRRAAALREMAKGQSLVTRLRAMVLPSLQHHVDVVAGMFQSILDCSAKSIAEIKLLQIDNRCGDGDAHAAVDDKMRIRKILSGDGDNAPQRKRRRRLSDDSVTLETPVPDYDGQQWRKYGQKLITNAKHPRRYYKCAYMRDQGCRATKTVQQQPREQEDGGADDDAAIYAVVYYGQHTCKPSTAVTNNVAVLESGSGADELARSKISVACTVDHHHRLLDMAGDLAEADGQLLDVAAFSPFDWDTNWTTTADAQGLLEYGEW